MVRIVIGNIVALIASLLMVYSGAVKKRKKILYIQTIQIGLSVISNIILGGIVGAIINALSCVRNVLCYKNRLGLREKIIITVLAILLSIKFNNLGLIGILPLISTITYLWLMTVKDVVKLKALIIFTMVLWFVYDLVIKSYSSSFFDLMTAVVNIYSIIKLKNKKLG